MLRRHLIPMLVLSSGATFGQSATLAQPQQYDRILESLGGSAQGAS